MTADIQPEEIRLAIQEFKNLNAATAKISMLIDKLFDERDALKAANAELVEAIRAFHYAYATGNASTDQAIDGLFRALKQHEAKQ